MCKFKAGETWWRRRAGQDSITKQEIEVVVDGVPYEGSCYGGSKPIPVCELIKRHSRNDLDAFLHVVRWLVVLGVVGTAIGGAVMAAIRFAPLVRIEF